MTDSDMYYIMIDAESQRFSLTICKDDGIVEFKTFDYAKYSKMEPSIIKAKNHLVDDIMDFIEAVYE